MSTAPVIFDIAYTPHHLKRGSSAKDIEKHARERAFYTMTGSGDTIYRYMTREGKICGEHLKRLTVLEYLQKSTGVFNGDRMISKDELADMLRSRCTACESGDPTPPLRDDFAPVERYTLKLARKD